MRWFVEAPNRNSYVYTAKPRTPHLSRGRGRRAGARRRHRRVHARRSTRSTGSPNREQAASVVSPAAPRDMCRHRLGGRPGQESATAIRSWLKPARVQLLPRCLNGVRVAMRRDVGDRVCGWDAVEHLQAGERAPCRCGRGPPVQVTSTRRTQRAGIALGRQRPRPRSRQAA
jgi:hypothetical protein